MQKSEPVLWNEENIDELFDFLLLKTIICVEAKNFPYFWFPQINMFVDFEDRDFEIIGKKLIEIREHPRKYIAVSYTHLTLPTILLV